MHPMSDAANSAPASETAAATPTDAKGTSEWVGFKSPLGGVMTRQVGTISGDLEARVVEGQKVEIRYLGALDVYRVKGSLGGRSIDEVVKVLTVDAGLDEDDNPQYTDLNTKLEDDVNASGTA